MQCFVDERRLQDCLVGAFDVDERNDPGQWQSDGDGDICEVDRLLSSLFRHIVIC